MEKLLVPATFLTLEQLALLERVRQSAKSCVSDDMVFTSGVFKCIASTFRHLSQGSVIAVPDLSGRQMEFVVVDTSPTPFVIVMQDTPVICSDPLTLTEFQRRHGGGPTTSTTPPVAIPSLSRNPSLAARLPPPLTFSVLCVTPSSRQCYWKRDTA